MNKEDKNRVILMLKDLYNAHHKKVNTTIEIFIDDLGVLLTEIDRLRKIEYMYEENKK